MITDYFRRIFLLLTAPQNVWPVIDDEPLYEPRDLVQSVALPLLLAGTLARLIGHGITLPNVIGAMTGFALLLAKLSLLVFIISTLAARFGGAASRIAATKLALYASIPEWIGLLFLIWPRLALVANMLFLWNLYLYWTGLPILMKPPSERRFAYFIAIAAAVVMLAAFTFVITLGIDAVAAVFNARRRPS